LADAAMDQKVGGLPALLTLGGLAAAFGLASCCALPMLLYSLGIGTAWLGGIGLYALLHRPVFLVVAAAGLIGGAVLLAVYRRRMTSAAICMTAGGILIGLVLLYFGYSYV
jgi:mercuric ion transport protein